jgi:hypothetical protein
MNHVLRAIHLGCVSHTEVSKVFTFITQVEVEILAFKDTSVEVVEVSTQAFYLSRSIMVLVSKLLKVLK